MVSCDAVPLPSTSLLYSARAVKSDLCGLPTRPRALAGEGRRAGLRCTSPAVGSYEPAAGAGERSCGRCWSGAGSGASSVAVAVLLLLLAAMPQMLTASSTLQAGRTGGDVNEVCSQTGR